jgi:hypothetical protein
MPLPSGFNLVTKASEQDCNELSLHSVWCALTTGKFLECVSPVM